FPCQQRPKPADPRAIEWRTVGMFAVTIVIVAIPIRARRQVTPQQRIDGLDSTENARIVSGTKPEPYQRQRIGTDQKPGFEGLVPIRPVADGNQPMGPRIGVAR